MSDRTGRGFPAPTSLPDQLSHNHERVYVVRLTDWERRFLRVGESHPFVLMGRDDGSYDLVKVKDV